MRHIPMPVEHCVAREDLERANALLRSADHERLLRQRLPELRRVIAFALSFRLELRDVLFVECGAHQHTPPLVDDWERNPAIADFLALHGEEIGIDYRAFDPAYSPEAFREALFGESIRSGAVESPFFREHPERKVVLAERIRAVSLASYDDVRALVTSESRPVVLFSSQVLNDPNRSDDMPFWRLPGLHYHSASLVEMDDILSAQNETLGHRDDSLEEQDYADEDFPHALLRQIAGPRAVHLRAFADVFGITAAVRRRFSSDGMMRYFWSAAT